jgi:hypothetical protein
MRRNDRVNSIAFRQPAAIALTTSRSCVAERDVVTLCIASLPLLRVE